MRPARKNLRNRGLGKGCFADGARRKAGSAGGVRRKRQRLPAGESGSGRRGGTYAAKATRGFGTGGPETAGLAYRAGEEEARRFSCPERTNLV